jgi:hypothetical protein
MAKRCDGREKEKRRNTAKTEPEERVSAISPARAERDYDPEDGRGLP